MHPSWEKQRRSNSAWSLVLALGIVLVLIAAAFPFLVLGGQASCESLVQCVGTELLLFPAGFMLLTAWNTFRKRDPGKIRGLKIALAVVMPIALILGLFAGDIFIPPVASEDRIIDAGRGVLEFDSFLTIGWTIGFTLVGGVLRELRALRLKLVEIGAANIPDGQELMERSRKLGLEAFVEVATSIFLILISAFFAVRAILVGGPISLMLSMLFLGIGAVWMIIGWHDLYSRTEWLMYMMDTFPRSKEQEKAKSLMRVHPM